MLKGKSLDINFEEGHKIETQNQVCLICGTQQTILFTVKKKQLCLKCINKVKSLDLNKTPFEVM